MRLAIFSDVHGNFHALQAVLTDIDSMGSFDQIIFAGDLVWGAALPLECIAALQERKITAVYGNTDQFLWEPLKMPEQVSEDERQEWQRFYDLVAWIKEKIGVKGLEYLQSLPFELSYSPTQYHADDLLIVHANPKDVHVPIFPPEMLQEMLMGKIRQKDAEVEPLLEGVIASVVVYGHVHVPNVRKIGQHLLANIASVSRPQDQDWRSKYGILHFENGTWQVQHRYVEYDIDAARSAILDSDMPDAEQAAQALMPPENRR